MSKQCPWYQGVCTLNEDFICYTDKYTCDIYKDWLEQAEVTGLSDEDKRYLRKADKLDDETIRRLMFGEET